VSKVFIVMIGFGTCTLIAGLLLLVAFRVALT
jgi:hypothetical protein